MEKEQPIAIYNSEVPELVAVFRNVAMFCKYCSLLGGKSPSMLKKMVWKSLHCSRVCKKETTPLNLRLAFRIAQQKHLDLLQEKNYHIVVAYLPQPEGDIIKTFHSTKYFNS